MNLRQYDPVKLAVPRPDLGLAKGAGGVIVEVYTSPHLGYQVEFLSDDGHTLGVWIVKPQEVVLDQQRRSRST